MHQACKDQFIDIRETVLIIFHRCIQIKFLSVPSVKVSNMKNVFRSKSNYRNQRKHVIFFPACEPGLWGDNCVNRCSDNCINPACNVTTGVCEGGCRSGYTGDHCGKGNIFRV